jgi:hypothetical protein
LPNNQQYPTSPGWPQATGADHSAEAVGYWPAFLTAYPKSTPGLPHPFHIGLIPKALQSILSLRVISPTALSLERFLIRCGRFQSQCEVDFS